MSDTKKDPLHNLISADKDIDVSEIMEAVKKRIQEKKDAGILKDKEIREIEEMELQPLPDFLEIPNVFEPHLYPEHKFPEFVHFTMEKEIEEGFLKKTMAKIRGLFMPILRFILRPFITDLRNLIIELHNKNKREIHNLKPLKPIVFQSKEYIKLLHNCANNTIVELSKLKVEEEMLKTKIRILEDKIELLEKRERALEKQVFT